MRKRLMSILLCLVMLFSLVPGAGVTASAAEPEWTTVNTFEELYTAVKDKKEYIKLGQKIDTSSWNEGNGLSMSGALSFEDKNFVLDLNGKTLNLQTKNDRVYSFIYLANGSLTIKDSSPEKKGNISGYFGSTASGCDYRTIFVGEKGSLTLEGGTFSADGKPYSTATEAIYCRGGSVTVKDGVTIIQRWFHNSGYAHDLDGYGYALHTEGRSKAIIDGGEFIGHVKLSGYQDANGSVQINGGTFREDVQVLYTAGGNNSDPAVTVNGGTFKGHVYLQDWPWRDSLYMPYRLNGGTFYGAVDLHADKYIYKIDSPTGNPNIALGLDKCFGYSAVVTPKGTFTGANAYTAVLKDGLPSHGDYRMWFYGMESNPARIIPNAWGMKSVTLDGNPIDYFKDWKGTVERMDNSTAHTLKFEWYPLASELVNAGYSYNARCEHYISGSSAVQQTDTITADKTSHTVTIPVGADPKVYSFDLHLNLKKDGSSVGIYSNEHIVKLVVNEAPPAPPEPVAHSITITNTHGTADPATAIAGETITVKANDRTDKNLMFTQWYTKTAGVTFANVNDRETTFVMPDRDVQVNPGYQEVWFTKQPIDSWLSSVDDSSVYFAFSQPITSWKLVNQNDQTLASGDAESANALVEATLARRDDGTEMTCRVIVTSNGQNFTSRTFDLKWYNVPGAPDVTVYPAGGKFVETLEVNLKTPNTYWWILYTTDGSDPYDKSGTTWVINPRAKVEKDSTQVTISKDTTIKACLYNYEGYSNMEKFGDIATCDFTKVELTPPVADPPSGTSFYDSLNVSLSTDIVNAKIMLSYNDGDVDDLSDPNQWKEYEPEKESITLSGSYGMHGFDAVTGIRMEHPDGYTYWVHSDKQEYLYPRISYADMANASVTGIVNEKITPTDVSITLHGDVFAEYLTAGEEVSGWFTNLPDGLKATVKEKTNYTATLVITISGTPTAASAAAISVEMPKSALRYTGTGTAVEQTVLSNPKAVYNIGTDAAHTHDYTGQPHLYLDPGNHYQECKAGDGGLNIEAHTFGNWMPNSDGTTQSRICTKCKHTETASISMYSVTVSTDGNGTAMADKTSAAAGTVITLTAKADAGYTFKQWQVVTGGVTIKDNKFTMPAGNVEIKAIFEKNATPPPAPTVNPFVDVPAGSFYYDAVLWAVEKGVTTGTSATTFEPDGSCTRAQAVTFLWRVAGCPAPKSAAMPFTDVKAGSFYYDAVLWAVENGITKGTSETTFEPEAYCTRAQIVTLIWRAQKSPAAGTDNPFNDVKAGSFYETAVLWAVKAGVTKGTSATTFEPEGICTRAQIVTFIWRCMK